MSNPESIPPVPSSRRRRGLVAAGVLLAGLIVLIGLVALRPTAKRAQPKNDGALVEVMTVEKVDHDAVVEAHGEVIPAQEVDLQPQVGGRVTWLSANLVPGGLLKKGEDILKIDARDYQLMVEQQGAAVERAKLDLQLEKGRKVVAEKEWELLRRGNEQSAPNALVLREPQMKTAEVALKSAESSLRRAWLDLSRTTLEAPFNAVVVAESVNEEQVVTPQSRMARLVGTDAFWIQVSVPVDELEWIRAPGPGHASTEGSDASVFFETRGRTHQRNGRVVRLLGDLDPAGRMARLLVEVKDPFGFDRQEESTIPLLLGAYVRVEIRGQQVQQVAEIPRRAVHDGDAVYVMSDDATLDVREVSIVRRGSDRVWVSAGLEEGERVVTTKLNAPLPGMKLRVAERSPPANEPAVAAESLD